MTGLEKMTGNIYDPTKKSPVFTKNGLTFQIVIPPFIFSSIVSLVWNFSAKN